MAKTYPEPQKLKRKDSGSFETKDLSSTYVSKARFILRHAPDLAENVRAGHLSLDNAYEGARVRKGQAETYEARFNALKAAAPDLAEMVTDSPLNLEEAQAALFSARKWNSYLWRSLISASLPGKEAEY